MANHHDACKVIPQPPYATPTLPLLRPDHALALFVRCHAVLTFALQVLQFPLTPQRKPSSQKRSVAQFVSSMHCTHRFP